ncbi:SpoIIE family protein phosphatase [Spirillospora sp. CA-253888]
MDALGEAVVVVDAAGTVQRVNAAARELLGDLCPGRPVTDTAVPVFRQALGDGRPGFDGDHAGRRLVGRRSALPDGRTAWIVRDVTLERGREDALLEERRRARFLARTSRTLSGVLHLRRAWTLAVRLTADALADQAAITLRREHGAPETAVSRHGEVRFETGPPHDTGAGRVLESGRLERHDAVGTARALRLCPPGVDPAVSADCGTVSVLLVPLTAYGTCLGVLTLVRARPYDDRELELVRDHADRVALALDAARLYQGRAATATRLRTELLPSPLPAIPGVRLGAAYRAAAEGSLIGGDFYEVLYSPHQGWLFALGDVCGKGVGAAVYTGQVRQALRAVAGFDLPLVECLDVINRMLLIADDSRFATLMLGRLSALGDGAVRVELASGGHLPPMLLRRDGRVEEVEMSGAIVGALPDAEFERNARTLDPGDALYLYTDGVTEARDGGRRMYGAERLRRDLAAYAGAPPGATAEHLDRMVMRHLDSNEHDDIAILGVQAWPPGHRMGEDEP